MRRTAFNFWLDLLSFVVMVGLALTGGVNHYVLPSGTGNWLTLFGLNRHDYGQIHFYLGLAVVVLLVLHLAMHWSWLCGFVAKKLGKEQASRRTRNLAGAVAVGVVGLSLVGSLVGAAALVQNRFVDRGRRRGPAWPGATQPAGASSMSPVTPQPPDREQEWPRRAGIAADEDEVGCAAAAAINGRMSLQDAAAVAGLSIEDLLRALGISYPVDAQERLGRLRRQFGFTMQEVRGLVCSKR